MYFKDTSSTKRSLLHEAACNYTDIYTTNLVCLRWLLQITLNSPLSYLNTSGSFDSCQVTSVSVLLRLRWPNSPGMRCSLLPLPNSGTQRSSVSMSTLRNGCCSKFPLTGFPNRSQSHFKCTVWLLRFKMLCTIYTVRKAWDYHGWWRLAGLRTNAQHPRYCTEESQPPPVPYGQMHQQNCSFEKQVCHLKQWDIRPFPE